MNQECTPELRSGAPRNGVPGYNLRKDKKSGGCGVATAPATYFQEINFRQTTLILALLDLKPDLWQCRSH